MVEGENRMTEAIKQQTGYAQVNSTNFYYERAGTGEPLVLIHAGIADRRMWDNQVHGLAGHYQVIRYDAGGYGLTPIGSDDHSRSQDLHGLLQALDFSRATLLGCSQGGTTGLDFALEQPGMTDALILVSTVPSGYNFEGKPPQKLLDFMAAYQQQELDQAAELATHIWFDGPQRQPSQVSSGVREGVYRMIREVIATSALDLTGEKSAEQPAVDRLDNVQCPTLVIVGEQDDASIINIGEHLTANIPGAEKAVIQGTAHLPNIERPEVFNHIVLDFLQRQGV